jgi:hypothetical protein
MPKPKPRKESPPVAVDLCTLTREQLLAAESRHREDSRKTLELLGLRTPNLDAPLTAGERNEQNRILQEIAVLLYGFKPLVANPTPSDAYYRESLAPILAAAEALWSAITESPVRDYVEELIAPRSRSARKSWVRSPRCRVAYIERVCGVLREEIARLRRLESRGRPDSTMFANLVPTSEKKVVASRTIYSLARSEPRRYGCFVCKARHRAPRSDDETRTQTIVSHCLSADTAPLGSQHWRGFARNRGTIAKAGSAAPNLVQTRFSVTRSAVCFYLAVTLLPRRCPPQYATVRPAELCRLRARSYASPRVEVLTHTLPDGERLCNHTTTAQHRSCVCLTCAAALG